MLSGSMARALAKAASAAVQIVQPQIGAAQSGPAVGVVRFGLRRVAVGGNRGVVIGLADAAESDAPHGLGVFGFPGQDLAVFLFGGGQVIGRGQDLGQQQPGHGLFRIQFHRLAEGRLGLLGDFRPGSRRCPGSDGWPPRSGSVRWPGGNRRRPGPVGTCRRWTIPRWKGMFDCSGSRPPARSRLFRAAA